MGQTFFLIVFNYLLGAAMVGGGGGGGHSTQFCVLMSLSRRVQTALGTHAVKTHWNLNILNTKVIFINLFFVKSKLK
jgi:hypothetical protein